MQPIRALVQNREHNTSSVTTPALTRALLACGVFAGPLYIVVGLLEMLLRPGFDLRRHSLSLLSNGDWGWVHIALFIVTGLLTTAGAVGMWRALRTNWGKSAGPFLVGLYGVSLIGAGIFTADPALGFPPGTPMDANTVGWHGMLHLATGGIGFMALVAACVVFARNYAIRKQRGWAAYSLATGILFLAAFYGIATGSQQSDTMRTAVIFAFTGAVVLSWLWVSATAARLMQRVNNQ